MKLSESRVRKIVREELLRLMEQEAPKPASLDDLEFMSNERVAYEEWARRHGHPSAEVESVLADYIVDQKLENSHDLHKKLCKELGFDHDALMARIGSSDSDAESDEDARELDLARVVEAISNL